MTNPAITKFSDRMQIDVSEYIEKKNGLSYLSWSDAAAMLLKHDPLATWHYPEEKYYGASLMVFCTVKAFGKEMTAQLPVMDHRNKAITNPDAFQVNVAMQRCLAKAIALHGIGLYIYQGEDLPESSEPPEPQLPPTLTLSQIAEVEQAADAAGMSIADICKVGKVSNLSEIPAHSFVRLLKWIKEQQPKQKEEPANPANPRIASKPAPVPKIPTKERS